MSAEGFEQARFSGTGLACRRGGRCVFAGLDFAVASGEALVLRGPNGSGKTTLLRLMAGLAAVSAGAMQWNGAAVHEDPEAHGSRLRFVGHLDAVKPAFTVAENLAFWAALWGARTNVLHALQAFDLARLATFPARHLSAGQRHRLALARLLVVPAPLWLLDEPSNALDEASLQALAKAIAAHRARGGMAIVASHGPAPMENARDLDLAQFTPTDAAHWSDAA